MWYAHCSDEEWTSQYKLISSLFCKVLLLVLWSVLLCTICWLTETKLPMFSMSTYPDLRMHSYISQAWKGKVTSHPVTLVRTPQRDIFSKTLGRAVHMTHSMHGHYHANQMLKPEGNNNMMQPSYCGSEDHILLWRVWERLVMPVWSTPQPPTPHPSDSLFTCRQEGCLLEDHHLWLLNVCDSPVALVKGLFVFSLTAKFLKARHVKPKCLEEQNPAAETAASLSSLKPPTTPSVSKNRALLTNYEQMPS